MIFPVNVFKKTLNTRKLMASDKTSIIVQAFIIGNVLLYIVLHHIFTVILGLSTVWVIIVQVVLFIAVGVIIFGFAFSMKTRKCKNIEILIVILLQSLCMYAKRVHMS